MRSRFNILLGLLTCVLLITLSYAPAFSRIVPADVAQSVSLPESMKAAPINQHLMADLREAESVLAQSTPDGRMQRYAALLTASSVMPNAPSSAATGVAGAVLVGDRLVVRGDFNGLSSALRDYTKDPVNPPNPNITSAVHIHQGDRTQNGPFQYALNVTLNDTGKGGRLAGEYTLTGEQLQALADGKLYVDLHTKQNRAGELRGMFRPL